MKTRWALLVGIVIGLVIGAGSTLAIGALGLGRDHVEASRRLASPL
jgi:hypothetical protein